jgi:putative glutathione S-transferase
MSTRTDDLAQLRGEVEAGRFVRQANAFADRITADGSSGFPAEAGRYVLYWCSACPWAHRQVIVRELRGLTGAIDLVRVNPWRDESGWNMQDGYDDHVNGFTHLSEAYLATDPAYEARVTVPTIWDMVTGRVVTNDYPVIDIQLNDEFGAVAEHDHVDLHPEDLRDEIAELDRLIYHDVNNGVYKAGFSTTQDAYEDAFDALFGRLDWLEDRLADRRFLCGDRLTLADVRLFTTLVRFDAVYHNHFRCNRNTLRELPNLWGYARDLFQTRGFGTTVDFDEIKRHYYTTHEKLNPSAIVPKGPAAGVADWTAAHGRDGLGPAAAV